jgi:hypothetical protein
MAQSLFAYHSVSGIMHSVLSSQARSCPTEDCLYLAAEPARRQASASKSAWWSGVRSKHSRCMHLRSRAFSRLMLLSPWLIVFSN